jgi:hypothetical protein
MATLNYLGTATPDVISTTSGTTATITFAAPGTALGPSPVGCRARHLFIDIGLQQGENVVAAPAEWLGWLFVTAIRVNGGPNLISGEIPVGMFNATGPNGGFQIGELNIALDPTDVVTVELLDRNFVAQQTIIYRAQLKVDSDSSSATANTAAATVGSPCYYLGGTFIENPGSPVILVAGGGTATWSSVAPFDGFLDYCINFQASSNGPTTFPFVLILAQAGPSPIDASTPSLNAGTVSIAPQSWYTNSAGMATGLQCRVAVSAGDAVLLRFLNDDADEHYLSLAWTFVSA